MLWSMVHGDKNWSIALFDGTKVVMVGGHW